MEQDEKKANDEQQTEEPDEIADLDLSGQNAEDVTAGAIGRIEPRFPTAP